MAAYVLGEWSDPERVAEYLARDIPHREIAEQLLLDVLRAQVGHVLDLGTGDGRLLALVRDRHPHVRGVGLDLSPPMLESARRRFETTSSVELVVHDLARPLKIKEQFDVVVSGLAIHHLHHARKRMLFREVHALLVPGGVFANLDLMASVTAQQHERFRRAIGRIEDDPADRLAGLCEQLAWLHDDAGFEEVDCHFKWLELALIIAVRVT